MCVDFEMMLTASYVLLTLGGGREQVRAGMTYVVISLLASALFVAALALLYTATGTVNMADLAGKVDELPEGLRSGFRSEEHTSELPVTNTHIVCRLLLEKKKKKKKHNKVRQQSLSNKHKQ